MKLLLLHASHLEFQPHKKAVDSAEECDKEAKRIEECLVVFNAFEAGDEKDISYVIEKANKEIRDVADQVKTNRIVIYPWVHLTSKPGDLEKAMESQKMLEEKLKDDYEVTRSAFGWYKEFEIHVKGHPLSELSREIRPEGEKVEQKVDPEKLLGQISKTKLDRKDLKENDHRIIGQKMDLFSFYNTAPGMVFWHENGTRVLNELKRFWREMHRKAGYREISTPMVLDEKLWKISGHWEKYRDNMFPTEYEERDMALKPMNCPGGILVYKSRSRSYRELPLRFGELGTVYREELSGVLSGLFRVNCFTQDDAHIYCKEDQLKEEIKGVMDLTDKIYSTFNLDYSIELSTRPEKRIGDEKIWDKSEEILKDVLDKNSSDYDINEGDGAFYGPKIDFHIEDSLGRRWQCGTIQLDFSMPERFDLTYVGKDNKEHRPILIHRAILGSLERFLGIILEHTNGNLPTWLAPVQVRVLSITDRNISKGKEVLERLRDEGIRADCNFDSTTLSEKVREAEIERVPYIVVIGDKEEQKGTLAVRRMWKDDVEYGVDPDKFIDELNRETKPGK